MDEKIKQSTEDIKHIRQIMEQSNKFLSLSGLSGIFAGTIALVGVFFAYKIMRQFEIHALSYTLKGDFSEQLESAENQLLILAFVVLTSALLVGFIFTYLKAKKKSTSLLNPTAFKVAWALFIPLSFGGIFTIVLAHNHLFQFATAATLLFYGMSLLNASKFLNIEIKYLAISEMILGTLAVIITGQVIIFWAIGFGVLHILYGTIMYFKYDRKH